MCRGAAEEGPNLLKIPDTLRRRRPKVSAPQPPERRFEILKPGETCFAIGRAAQRLAAVPLAECMEVRPPHLNRFPASCLSSRLIASIAGRRGLLVRSSTDPAAHLASDHLPVIADLAPGPPSPASFSACRSGGRRRLAWGRLELGQLTAAERRLADHLRAERAGERVAGAGRLADAVWPAARPASDWARGLACVEGRGGIDRRRPHAGALGPGPLRQVGKLADGVLLAGRAVAVRIFTDRNIPEAVEDLGAARQIILCVSGHESAPISIASTKVRPKRMTTSRVAALKVGYQLPRFSYRFRAASETGHAGEPRTSGCHPHRRPDSLRQIARRLRAASSALLRV